VTDLVNHLRIRRVDLIPTWAIGGPSGAEAPFAFSHNLFSVDGTTSECLKGALVDEFTTQLEM
jgi:hypothetical protein